MAKTLRRVALAVLLSALVSTGAAASGVWQPGVETNGTAQLDPRFADQITALVVELKAEGHHPRIAATYRDPERQNFIFELGQILELFGARPMTRARGGRSCHNHQDEGGPAALAADILPGRELTTAAEKAAFFHALGKAAKARGLGWGGSWAQRNPTWRKYGLGWDPAHVQSARCRW